MREPWFHWTCLFCRDRRKALGKWVKPSKWISYFYLCMPFSEATAFKIDREHKRIYQFTVMVPTVLRIDPRGHFTRLRCAVIVWLDRLGLRFKWLVPRIANACEFLANYPAW